MPNILVPRKLGDIGVGQSRERKVCREGSRKQQKGVHLRGGKSRFDLALPHTQERIGMRGEGSSQGLGGISSASLWEGIAPTGKEGGEADVGLSSALSSKLTAWRSGEAVDGWMEEEKPADSWFCHLG